MGMSGGSASRHPHSLKNTIVCHSERSEESPAHFKYCLLTSVLNKKKDTWVMPFFDLPKPDRIICRTAIVEKLNFIIYNK
jgi:hypothetical protein